jgi:pimeloyl-ACP methyl ester carboxylesterase
VTVENMSVHYDVLGPPAGFPVVLVHGLGGRAEEWLDLSHYLVMAGYCVYLPDLPGYDRSEKPADFSYSVRDESNAECSSSLSDSQLSSLSPAQCRSLDS